MQPLGVALFLFLLLQVTSGLDVNRSFSIDYDANTFLKDGEPFRYVSGSLHYFRSPRESWPRLLQALRWAGINAVSTYIEWSLHEPTPGVYNFDGDADLLHFLDLAQEIGLLVLLRPGPYICAERDLGGYPPWLWTLHPGMQLRTTDPNHLKYVSKWFAHLMPKLKPYLYGNGGPVIMVQVENEYSSWSLCQREYAQWLRDEIQGYVSGAALLYSTDGAFVRRPQCSKIENVYATVDFGPGSNVTSAFFGQRLLEPVGPLVNSEYYPGWLTHWSESGFARVNSTQVAKTLEEQLKLNASVNFYMFHGGTNFGFTSGANTGGVGDFLPQITSYDYDAPITEAGDLTEKYYAIRDVISRYLPLPGGTEPQNTTKVRRGPLLMHPVISLLDAKSRQQLGDKPKTNSDLISFESLGIQHGLVLYETQLPERRANAVRLLASKDVHDRAYVILDNVMQLSLLDRLTGVNVTAVNVTGVNTLGLLVEDMGRINFGVFDDSKGILSPVSLDQEVLHDWTITGFSLNNISWVESLPIQTPDIKLSTPVFFKAAFQLSSDETPPRDSFLDLGDWNKGIAWLNGHNLGRYWPHVGPQRRLFVPNAWVRPYPESNQLVILELYRIPINQLVSWESEPDSISSSIQN